MATHEKLARILKSFQIAGTLNEVRPFGSGHINLSFLASFENQGRLEKYLLQRINSSVFQNVPALMKNIELVSAHLQKKPDFILRTLRIVPTLDGSTYCHTDAEYWRVFDFIDNVKSYDRTPNAHVAREAALGCAQFQLGILDIPVQLLTAAIPNFQDVSRRLLTLERSANEDLCGRARAVKTELKFLRDRAPYASGLASAIQAGGIPIRPVHADLKINNILFDAQSGEASCIVDWDTLMPGTIAYDFGDFARSSCLAADEDERDLSKVKFDLQIFEAITDGYLGRLASEITSAEIATLSDAPKIIALSLASRFLSDHIDGDKYFPIERENHNLDRAEVQIKLLEDMERHAVEMTDIVQKFRRA